MKTRISRKIEWDMAHRLPDHQSLCRHIHGHRYVAEVTIEGHVIDEQGSPERGMVRDFGYLKQALSFIPEQLDHSFMIYKDDPILPLVRKIGVMLMVHGPTRIVIMEFIPTAENIATFIFNRLNRDAQDRPLNVIQVTVWETPSCKATVTA